MTHLCHWPGCPIEVEPKLYACRRHWFTLPKWIRDLIWKHYVVGQETRKDPSRAYLAATDTALVWIRDYLAGQIRTARGETINKETGEITR